jgi:hypothetical protein
MFQIFSGSFNIKIKDGYLKTVFEKGIADVNPQPARPACYQHAHELSATENGHCLTVHEETLHAIP